MTVNTQTATHATLLARLSSGEGGGAAWGEFVERYADLVRGFCRRQGVWGPDADDVLQDVLLGLTKAMPGFVYDPSKGRFRGYLKAATLHAILKRSCQKRGGAGLEEVESMLATATGDADIDARWEAEWRQHHLRRAMVVVRAEFGARDVAAFERYAVSGEEAAGVAKDLGMSVDSVYQARTRIVRRLSAIIEAQVADEG
jgi:RNA polymerase sigma-70 factor (ECF subfamily)